MTVEAAVIMPIFFVCMVLIIQMINVYGNAVRLQSAMTQTGEEMAIGAYATAYAETDNLLGVTLSLAYGSARSLGQAGELPALRGTNFVLSSFLEEDDLIDLVCTYQMKPVVGIVHTPWKIFVQRTRVRAWTGRDGSDGVGEQNGEDEDAESVYVTEHGRVYHTDRACSHIKLSIISTSMGEAKAARNANGEKYHACEKCGRYAGGMVYITKEGNRYHSSLSCSGLKRTVHKVKKSELGEMRACSACGGGK